MKILKLKDFLKEPEGTVFMSYKPVLTRGLYTKGESLETDDFIYNDVLPYGEGDKVILDGAGSRWGMFDVDEEFLVLDKEDVYAIIRLLTGNEIDEREINI